MIAEFFLRLFQFLLTFCVFVVLLGLNLNSMHTPFRKQALQFLLVSLVILTSCAPYPYEKHIKSHRIDIFGTPSRSTRLMVDGRSKAGYQPYRPHTLGVAYHYVSYSEQVIAPGVNESHSGSIMGVGIFYKPRINIYEFGERGSFSVELPMSLIIPIMADYTVRSGANVVGREAPGISEIGFYLPATFNMNFGRGAQELVRGPGFGFGAGYMIAMSPATDFRDNNVSSGYGPFSHGPYGSAALRFGAMELTGFYQYSFRHTSHHFGAKLGFSF